MKWSNIIIKGILYILSTLFIVLSIIYIMGQVPFITTDSFIGLAVGLIGIMVTFAIGFQIYNTLDSKKEIEAGLKKFDDLLTEKDSLIKQLRIELKVFKYNNQLDTFSEKYELLLILLKTNVYNDKFKMELKESSFLVTLDYFYLV